MKTLLLLPSALFIAFSSVFAQVEMLSPEEIIHLDSLMYVGNFQDLKTSFAKKDSIILETKHKSSDSYRQIRKSYLNIIEHVDTLTARDNEFLLRRIDGFKSQENQHTPELAGKRAFESYRNFRRAAGSNRFSEAFKSYYVAYFFRVKHIKSVIQKTRSEIRRGYSYFDTGDVDKAKEISDRIVLPTDHNKYLLSLVDSLASLRSKVDEVLWLRERRDWSQDQPIRLRASLAFGGTLFHRNTVTDGHLHFKGKENAADENIDFANVPGNFEVGFNFIAQYYFDSVILGMDFSYNRLLFDSSSMQELIFFDFQVKQISSHVYAAYLFRDRTGVRPYAGLGMGILRSRRGRSDAAILFKSEDENDGTVTPKFFSIERSTTTTARILFRFGIEYIHRKLQNIVFVSHFSIYHNFEANDFVKRVNYSLGLSLGLVL